MDTHTDEEPPPHSTDLEGWRQAVADGRFRNFKMEAIIAAIQDLGPKTEKMVLNPLVLHASDTIDRILRWKVGRNHHNEGEDIIARAHGQLVQAMFSPKSPDGKGLRVAFVPRVQFRAADAIRAELKKDKRERVDEAIEDKGGERPPQEIDPRQELDEKMDVERVLSHVTDERKRLAFRLHMEDYPLESSRSESIAKVLGVSSKTAGQWIEDVRAQLRNIVGEQS
jgi:DNA-directed RNA polymerase specialized sigma24 family protein